jgi:hypothetical protein
MSVLIRSNPSVYLNCCLRNLGFCVRPLLRPPCKPAPLCPCLGILLFFSWCIGCLVASEQTWACAHGHSCGRLASLPPVPLPRDPLVLRLAHWVSRCSQLPPKFDAYAPCCQQPWVLAGTGVASEASVVSMSACGVRYAWIFRYNATALGSGSSSSSVVTVLIERAHCRGRVSRG